MISRLTSVIAFVVGAALAVAPIEAQQADVIRGRVIGPDSLPVENVVVTATSIPGNVTRTARTDANGRYTITFPAGEGDYMVNFAAIGFAARRFEVKRMADEDILIADAKLAKVALLDAVQVTGTRDRPPRADNPPDVSGTERALSNAAVPADLMGDLAAMAASLPGVQGVPGENGDPNGYSVLGLGADQNNATLNGMQFGGNSLPRDAQVSSGLVTSPYDVSRGGFSGAQLNLRTRSGSNFLTRGMSLNVDAPQLQWTDEAAQALGQEYSNVSLGGTVSGPISYDKSFYNLAYQLGRRANDLQTLMSTDPVGLRAAGVSPDSAERLMTILNAAGIPGRAGPFREDRVGDQGSVFGNVDFAPPSSSSGQAVNLSFSGTWNKQSPISGLPTELPSFGGDRTSWRGSVQGRHNAYIRNTVLSETSIALSASVTESNPFLALPAGRVRVSSDFDDGLRTLQNLSFGGNQSLNSTQRTNTIGILNQSSWFSLNNKHRLKLTTELRRDAATQEQANNRLGTFTFNSLDDLQNDRPSSFSRMLSDRNRDLSQIQGAMSLGDSYRRTSTLQIQYGVRVDANHFLSAPPVNRDVEATFKRRNDRMPNKVYVSPRAGFSWTYGTAAQIAGFEGAARGPRAVLRGGAGLFQNMPSTNIVGSAVDNTGLANAVQQITCIGTATPVPDWSAYLDDPSLIPDRCADGSTGTVFANARPNVTLFSPDFHAPRSLRSNLQWSGPILKNRFAATVEATWSSNLNQQSTYDLNFNPQVRFTLPEEGGRPVYVNRGSIVPTSGQIASQDARVAPQYNRVTEVRSDLRSLSRQMSFRLAPVRFSPNFNWSASYVYSNVKERYRGFMSTISDPRGIDWGRSSLDSRHQIVYNLGYNLFDFVRVNWFGNFRSGNPYTPMIAGDVNGDGYGNDRAFIFNPSSASDPAVASAMQALLENGSAGARKCLSSQLGRLASRNSCQGPWSSTASMSFVFNPLKVRMPQRATISFQLTNPLGAADLIAHGSKGLRGWGQPTMPDAALLYVRGFDPATSRYSYEVNQRFGATNPSLSAFRAPVVLTAMMRFDMGPTRERQMLTQQLDRGRKTAGTKAPEIMLRAVFGNGGGVPNPMATILRQQDTLKLTGVQADSIAVLNRWYTIRIDSLWAPFVQYVTTLPDSYSHDEAYSRYLKSRKATVDLLMKLGPTVKHLLQDEQRRKLPAFVASYLEPRYLASIRSGTASFTGGSMFPGGDAMMAAGGMMMPAGAGGTGFTTVIRQ